MADNDFPYRRRTAPSDCVPFRVPSSGTQTPISLTSEEDLIVCMRDENARLVAKCANHVQAIARLDEDVAKGRDLVDELMKENEGLAGRLQSMISKYSESENKYTALEAAHSELQEEHKATVSALNRLNAEQVGWKASQSTTDRGTSTVSDFEQVPELENREAGLSISGRHTEIASNQDSAGALLVFVVSAQINEDCSGIPPSPPTQLQVDRGTGSHDLATEFVDAGWFGHLAAVQMNMNVTDGESEVIRAVSDSWPVFLGWQASMPYFFHTWRLYLTAGLTHSPPMEKHALVTHMRGLLRELPRCCRVVWHYIAITFAFIARPHKMSRPPLLRSGPDLRHLGVAYVVFVTFVILGAIAFFQSDPGDVHMITSEATPLPLKVTRPTVSSSASSRSEVLSYGFVGVGRTSLRPAKAASTPAVPPPPFLIFNVYLPRIPIKYRLLQAIYSDHSYSPSLLPNAWAADLMVRDDAVQCALFLRARVHCKYVYSSASHFLRVLTRSDAFGGVTFLLSNV
ncbi:hypothetical protein OF83DRAFT_1085133 [Amylostereum chailletii]|nr:hypothetical protein OF83DRAFT_1085133 [Amylostereum chailletii]